MGKLPGTLLSKWVSSQELFCTTQLSSIRALPHHLHAAWSLQRCGSPHSPKGCTHKKAAQFPCWTRGPAGGRSLSTEAGLQQTPRRACSLYGPAGCQRGCLRAVESQFSVLPSVRAPSLTRAAYILDTDRAVKNPFDDGRQTSRQRREFPAVVNMAHSRPAKRRFRRRIGAEGVGRGCGAGMGEGTSREAREACEGETAGESRVRWAVQHAARPNPSQPEQAMPQSDGIQE